MTTQECRAASILWRSVVTADLRSVLIAVRSVAEIPSANCAIGYPVVIKVSARLRVQEPRLPTYQRGDYVKVEFQDETTVIGESMWVRVHHCDDEKQLIFGTLGNQLVNDYGGKVELGSELAVSYSQIREHKKASDFTSKN
jgi:hypothetical protein